MLVCVAGLFVTPANQSELQAHLLVWDGSPVRDHETDHGWCASVQLLKWSTPLYMHSYWTGMIGVAGTLGEMEGAPSWSIPWSRLEQPKQNNRIGLFYSYEGKYLAQ